MFYAVHATPLEGALSTFSHFMQGGEIMKMRLSSQLLVVVLLMSSTLAPVRAQSPPPSVRDGDAVPAEEAAVSPHLSTQTTIWKANIGAQSALALSSWALRTQIDEMVEATIQNIIMLTGLYGDAISLEPTVPYLLDIYEQHRDERVRIMALMALHGVGDPGSMEILKRHVQEGESSERLRALTLTVLAEHYGLPGESEREE